MLKVIITLKQTVSENGRVMRTMNYNHNDHFEEKNYAKKMIKVIITLKQTVSEKGRVMRTRARERTVSAQPQT